MNESPATGKNTAILLALLAVLIWSGNFVVARDIFREIGPLSLNFYRWLLATLIILPFAIKKIRREWLAIRNAWLYLLVTALFGVSLFNSFVYIAAHHTTAINLALIGTTSSPIIAVILARIFLHEPISVNKILGMICCIAGVLYLLSGGNLEKLRSFHFGKGELWMLAAALTFAAYNTLVKKKPAEISHLSFLAVIFTAGTLMMLPFFFTEAVPAGGILWNGRLIFSIIYLGLGASVICFLIWNIAIARLGAGNTVLFGNLIPVFSSLEAVILLNEKIQIEHLVSFVLVVTGLIIANLKKT
jgi:drug/metabolite transporter (DMT)-like permease